MAKAITDKANTSTPTAEFPLGSIRDDTGTNDGTPVDKDVYSDVHQFLAKMMLDAGVTPNSLLDSESNGYQLIEALRKFPTDTTADVNALHGVFNESLPDIGLGDFTSSLGTAIFVSDGELYIGDSTKIRVYNAVTGVFVRDLTFTDSQDYASIFIIGDLIYMRVKETSTGDTLIRRGDKNTSNSSSLSFDITRSPNIINGQFFVNVDRIYSTQPNTIVVRVYDLDGVNKPGEEFSSNQINTLRGIFVIGNLAYVVHSFGVSVFNLTTKEELTDLSFGDVSGSTHIGINIIGNKAYLAGNNGVAVFDINSGVILSTELFNEGEDLAGVFIKDNTCYSFDKGDNKVRVNKQNLVTERI